MNNEAELLANAFLCVDRTNCATAIARMPLEECVRFVTEVIDKLPVNAMVGCEVVTKLIS